MKYKEAIDLFRTRLKRYSIEKPVEMTDDEILTELSIIQADLNNKYGLFTKKFEVTLTAGTATYTATYTAGTSGTSIPDDIMSITKVYLNDTLNSEVEPVSVNHFRGYTKSTSTPEKYAFYLQNSTAVMELDNYPDSAYTMTILYTPKLEIYHGVGGSNTNTTWADLDKTAAGWGGSLKVPSNWDWLVVNGALANVFPELKQEYYLEVQTALRTRPINFSGEIPSYGGISISPRITEIPGQDERRT